MLNDLIVLIKVLLGINNHAEVLPEGLEIVDVGSIATIIYLYVIWGLRPIFYPFLLFPMASPYARVTFNRSFMSNGTFNTDIFNDGFDNNAQANL